MKTGVKKCSNHEKTLIPFKVIWDGSKGTVKKIFIDGKKHYVSAN